MLDNEIKQRIDGARDVLVGQIPDPKGQVDQITTALVYKFMGDLDRRAEEEGGKRSFFVDGYSRFAWDALMDAKLGGSERRDLYAHAIEEMATNERLPELFRAMFKGTFLPFRDPRILTLFLKEIDMLPYRHSEDLGTAYEYLLSIMGTQGDAGQFRTPRHIIDFIVAVVDPHKGERIHDPACGTAGFLISAFRHIQQANTKDLPGDTLSPSDKRALTQNLIGCELDPGMVRLSLVNMYMHGIRQPQIREYDTLTYDELWDESYDAVLANPPFMTPKGGIHPHGRFAVQAKRSEVLFVDYIAEHLSLRGRAGVIVPEGIIFQSQRAYKELRRRLVEDWGLWAVISLPAGVFNPYSGVKTSILFLDKTAAKGAGEILFVRVSADGFDLGAQRRPVAENDLPQVRKILSAWKRGEKLEGSEMALWTPKEKIAEDGEYNLSAERYRAAVDYSNTKWPKVKLGEVCDLYRGVTYSKKDEVHKDGIKILRANNIDVKTSELNFSEIRRISEDVKVNPKQMLRVRDILVCTASGSMEHLGKVAYAYKDTECYFGAFMGCIRARDEMVDSRYLFFNLLSKRFRELIKNKAPGVNIQNLKFSDISGYEIPLPPLDEQQRIVAEIAEEEKAIAACRHLIDSHEKKIRSKIADLWGEK